MKRSRYPFLTAVTAIFSALLTFQPCFGQSAVFIDALKARQEGDHAAAYTAARLIYKLMNYVVAGGKMLPKPEAAEAAE